MVSYFSINDIDMESKIQLCPKGSFSDVHFVKEKKDCGIWGPPGYPKKFNDALRAVADYIKHIGEKMYDIIETKENEFKEKNDKNSTFSNNSTRRSGIKFNMNNDKKRIIYDIKVYFLL